MAQSVPVVPGHGDGGLSKRRMVQMAGEPAVGPIAEQAHLQLREIGAWWRIVGRFFEEDLEEMDKIRPAFLTAHGTYLLRENTS